MHQRKRLPYRDVLYSGSVKTMYDDDQGLSNAMYIHVCKAITRQICDDAPGYAG